MERIHGTTWTCGNCGAIWDDDDRRAGRGTSLISTTRSRNDGMTGLKGLFLRPIIRTRSRDAVRSYLDQVKRQVERPAPADP